jgi:hypothetical protein
MATIHFIGGEKGGVGKSVLTRVIAQHCIDLNIPFVGYDTDRSHGSFSRFYADYASPVVVDDVTSIDRVVENLCEDPTKHALVDLAAQTLRPLREWIDTSGMLELLAEQNHRAMFWHVMDDSRDSLTTLDALLAAFGDSVSYVIVFNHGRGSSFAHVEQSAAFARAKLFGAKIVALQRLNEGVMHKIDQANTSFWAATHRTDATCTLGLLDRQRVKVWLRRTYQDIETILAKN